MAVLFEQGGVGGAQDVENRRSGDEPGNLENTTAGRTRCQAVVTAVQTIARRPSKVFRDESRRLEVVGETALYVEHAVIEDRPGWARGDTGGAGATRSHHRFVEFKWSIGRDTSKEHPWPGTGYEHHRASTPPADPGAHRHRPVNEARVVTERLGSRPCCVEFRDERTQYASQTEILIPVGEPGDTDGARLRCRSPGLGLVGERNRHQAICPGKGALHIRRDGRVSVGECEICRQTRSLPLVHRGSETVERIRARHAETDATMGECDFTQVIPEHPPTIHRVHRGTLQRFCLGTTLQVARTLLDRLSDRITSTSPAPSHDGSDSTEHIPHSPILVGAHEFEKVWRICPASILGASR